MRRSVDEGEAVQDERRGVTALAACLSPASRRRGRLRADRAPGLAAVRAPPRVDDLDIPLERGRISASRSRVV
jgi:hypothetical protein